MTTFPSLIASARPLIGQSLAGKRADLDLIERFAKPAAIERWFEGAAARGVGAVATLSDHRILHAARKQAAAGMEIIPIVPNVMGLVREATEYGMMGAGFRMVRRLGLRHLFLLGFRSMPKAPAVLKRDFCAILSVLYDLELRVFHRFRPQRVLLHPQIADLALALGNRKLFDEFARAMRRSGIEPGVSTGNFGHLAARFGEWVTDIRLVATPVNGAGWQMKPTREACETQFTAGHFDIVADRPSLAPPPSQADLAAARAWSAVKSVMVDVADWEAWK